MKQINNWVKATAMITLLLFPFSQNIAGNPQRAGSAGASELLINPWARTSGWGGSNIAGVRGLEGIYSNVAGLAFTQKTELIFSQTSWLQYGGKMFSADDAVSTISSFGFSQKVGESGVLGLAIMSMDFGEIEITTENLPDGGIGTYSPRYMNIGFSKRARDLSGVNLIIGFCGSNNTFVSFQVVWDIRQRTVSFNPESDDGNSVEGVKACRSHFCNCQDCTVFIYTFSTQLFMRLNTCPKVVQ